MRTDAHQKFDVFLEALDESISAIRRLSRAHAGLPLWFSEDLGGAGIRACERYGEELRKRAIELRYARARDLEQNRCPA